MSVKLTDLLVRTKSLAWILHAPIWPFWALCLIWAMSAFSCFSSLTRCWSSSRIALSSIRWFLRKRSAGVMRFPKAHSSICGRGAGRKTPNCQSPWSISLALRCSSPPSHIHGAVLCFSSRRAIGSDRERSKRGMWWEDRVAAAVSSLLCFNCRFSPLSSISLASLMLLMSSWHSSGAYVAGLVAMNRKIRQQLRDCEQRRLRSGLKCVFSGPGSGEWVDAKWQPCLGLALLIYLQRPCCATLAGIMAWPMTGLF